MADITIEQYEPSDLDGVLLLLKESLGETSLLRRTPEWFGWKHFDNPFGQSIMLVARTDHRIVGLRAFMRWDLVTPSGARLRCVRAVDTATHPDYQRRGIFRRLTESALEVARADGVDMVFNTPNPKSGAGYLKMGWHEIGHIGVMVAPKPLRLLQRRDVSQQPDLADLLADAEPPGHIDVVDRQPRGLRTPRDAGYLDWRFDGNPQATYLCVRIDGGTAVLRANVRNGRTELVVSDVFGPELRRSLGAARRRSRAEYLVTWFPKGSPERSAAVKAGFAPVPKVQALRLIALPLAALPIDVDRLHTWDFAMSDLELL